jgi:membrane associated rhomboid family serine protease
VKQFRVEDDYRPLAWIGQLPIHATTLLVILHSAAMVAGVFAPQSWTRRMVFRPGEFLGDGAVWTPLTYAFLHAPSLYFVIGLLMLFWFGREVERFVGRARFLGLYAALLLLPPLALLPLVGVPSAALAGAWYVHFGVFTAFALLYPRAELLFGIQARWFALVLGAISLLQAIAARSAADAITLVVSTVAAWGVLTHAGFMLWPRRDGFFEPHPRRRDLRPPKPRARRGPEPAETVDPEAAMDRLLEKISQGGIGSLTAAERRELDRLREALLSKGRA